MTPADDPVTDSGTGEDDAGSNDVRTVDVLGVPVSATSLEGALEVIDEWVVTGAPGYACLTDVGALLASQHDASLRRALSGARLVLPSGHLLAWYSRRKGAAGAHSYPARDLLFACCTRSIAGGYRHFFYGPSETAVARLVTNLKKRLPDIVIAGACAPGTLSENGEDSETERRIKDEQPDIVWVGLGTPREECWMASQMDRGSKTVMVGMGLAYGAARGLHAARWISLCRAWRLTRRPAAGAPPIDLADGQPTP